MHTPASPDGYLELWSAPSFGRVLIVDPDAAIREALQRRLEEEGHRVWVAANAEEARAEVTSTELDVSLVDHDLLSADGYALLGVLRETQPVLETIAVTVDPTVELLVEALEAGVHDVVVKPFAALKLIAAKVSRALAKVQAVRHRDELIRILKSQDLSTNPEDGFAGPDAEDPDAGIDIDDMSGSDPVTGLSNRRVGAERFRKEASRALRYDRPLCIAIASIDGLEALGGTKELEDAVLRGFVQMFLGLIRDVDFVAHRGAGEFLFLFPETAKDDGVMVMERIRDKVGQSSFSPVAEGADAIRLTLSAGVAGLPADTMNGELLERAAESALESAQAEGDAVRAYTPDPGDGG